MSDAASQPHPCQRCGACCASFRVAFHWSEMEEGLAVQVSDPLRRHERVMRGTDDANAPRCIALQGMVGGQTRCGIYEHRPSPCREVVASLEDGVHRHPHCDRARQRYGLPLLQEADWAAWRNAS